MKLTVFGATGGTGTQVVTQALDAGHDVVAVVRDPARLPVTHPSLTIVTAGVLRPDEIAGAVAGRDAVISALGHGTRSKGAKASATFCADSARAIIAAMAQAGTRRLVIVSASGPFRDEGDDPLTRYLIKPFLGAALFKTEWQDLAAMEEVVRASGLDWTVLRPPRLTDKPLSGRYRTRADLNLRRGMQVARADVAHLALAVAADPQTYRTAIFLAD